MISFRFPPAMGRLAFANPEGDNNEQRAEGLRSLALQIEEALAKRKPGVSLDRPSASMVKHALMDLADRVDLD